jgi:hypothetical protein
VIGADGKVSDAPSQLLAAVLEVFLFHRGAAGGPS